MKKVVSLIILIATLLFVAQPCYAEFDVTGMLESGMSLTDIACAMEENVPLIVDSLSQLNTNEIAVLALILERELQRRDFIDSGVVVPMGEYIVGVDIPAGTYTVTAGQRYCSLEIYTNGKLVHDFDMYSGCSVGKVTLKNNQVVCVEYDSMTFAPYKGLGF